MNSTDPDNGEYWVGDEAPMLHMPESDEEDVPSPQVSIDEPEPWSEAALDHREHVMDEYIARWEQ
jgi:hypothetical protein